MVRYRLGDRPQTDEEKLVINTLRMSAMALMVTTVLFISSVTPTSAAPITGGVSFGGSWAPTGGTGIADATGVDIIGDVAAINCAFTTTCTGTYAPVTGFLGATYNDFTFAPLGGGITPLWSFVFGPNTYTFDLQTISVVTQNATFLTLSGTGLLKVTGFDDTFGQWTFSGDSAGATIAFSSTSSSAPREVSEPVSLTLLGLGLLGAGVMRRRRAP